MTRTYDDDEIVAFVAGHPLLFDLLAGLAGEDTCSFDHDGGCQTHYHFGGPDEMCPNGEAQLLLEAIGGEA